MLDRILDAAHRFVIQHIARDPDHKHIAQTLIEHQFGRSARVRAAEDNGKRVLAGG